MCLCIIEAFRMRETAMREASKEFFSELQRARIGISVLCLSIRKPLIKVHASVTDLACQVDFFKLSKLVL